jgi:3-hydroxybutyryl-CoA dehydrogenase
MQEIIGSEKITVVGSGTMGNGIAHVFALAGNSVHLLDTSTEALERARQNISRNMDRQVMKGTISAEQAKAALESIAFVDSLEKIPSDQHLIVEAVTENIEVKRKLFSAFDTHFDSNTVLSSNTSSISITALAAATKRPDRVIGMHFMNPVPVMKLVEIIKGYSTSEDTVQRVLTATRGLGKTPVAANDYPGFVSNRILMPMINEAIQTLFEGVAGVEEIDHIMMLGMAHPMGPLKLADFIGLDICANILNVLYTGFKQPRYAACPLLTNMVMAGKLGAKSGEGFYSWGADGKATGPAPRFAAMAMELS